MRRCNDWQIGFDFFTIMGGAGFALYTCRQLEILDRDYIQEVTVAYAHLERIRREIAMACHNYIQDAWVVTFHWNRFDKWRCVA